MSKLSRETATPKMKGAGDGIKNLAKSVDRTPVPSSRKFTATLHSRDETVHLKLKKALDELDRGKLKKAKTVAEITPTKSNRTKTLRRQVVASSILLHATPRPPADDVKEAPPPSGRGAETRQRQLKLLVYRRMLVLVWRRNKTRLAIVSESLRRQQEQISKYETQVSCLKGLTHSEGHKRDEAMGENQKLESIVDALQMENNSLIGEKVILQNQLRDLQDRVESSSIDLENLKNEINTKNIYLKRLENEFHKERHVAMQIKEENAVLLEKVKGQEVEIRAQQKVANRLNENLKDLETRLLECEEEKKAQEINLQALTEQCQWKSRSCDSLRHEVSRVASIKAEMRLKIEVLEEKLTEVSREYEEISKQNATLKMMVQEKKFWWKNAKEFAQVSWAVLQHAAYLMLPAL